MKTRHYTPAQIADVLASYSPDSVRSILEPAVGAGDLLAPFVLRFREQLERIICVDIDQAALRAVKGRFGEFSIADLTLVEHNYLNWALTKREAPWAYDLDCVVMNPPFAAKRADWVWLDSTHIDLQCLTSRFVPKEIAFTIHSIQRLREGGRLLAVVPHSLIAAENTHWFRNFLLQNGALLFVHELPKRTFSGVESRFYLLIYERGGRTTAITLSNHDLFDPESLVLTDPVTSPELRFDYGYAQAKCTLQKIIGWSHQLRWGRLGDLCRVLRGTAKSPEGKSYAVHTSDFRNSFWWKPAFENDSVAVSLTDQENRYICHGDLLMKRVGRNCGTTLNLASGLENYPCTDCVLILRPTDPEHALQTLFAARVLLSLSDAHRLVERGTGATYVTEKAIGDLEIPIGLASMFPDDFQQYRHAVELRDSLLLSEVERRVCQTILR